MTYSRTIRLERTLLLAWFLLNLVIGALTAHEYGMSIDEPNNQRYAADTLNAYPSLFGILYQPHYDSSYEGHGPAFVTLAAIFVRIVHSAFPAVFVPDLWHYAYFITFQLACLCLYLLAKRWFSGWTAWGILLLFGTQPLLLGQAFINPKDTPFMFFLALSILWGFRMVDATSTDEAHVSLEKPAGTLVDRFQSANAGRRRKFLIYLALASATALALVVFSGQVNALLGEFVRFFYNAVPDSLAGRVFSSVGSHSVPAEDYVTKALRLSDRLERGLSIAGLLFFLAYFGLLVLNATPAAFLRDRRADPYRLGKWVRASTKRLLHALNLPSLRKWFAEVLRALRSPAVILAGLALGLATAVRAIGPMAGAIVILYLFARTRWRAWATAFAYLLVAGIVTYLAWPRLWDAPVQHYLEELGIVSNFPHFPGRVLFNGRLFGPQDLPRSYLPVLLSIQFTEPAILCIYPGLGILIWQLLRGRLRTDLVLYIALGFFLPLCALILLNSTLYHNFRQVLFLIPAMFMAAAFVLELAFHKISQSWVRVLLIAAIALPGVSSTVKLYPYEYVYYNSLVGGPAGAAHRYELDYWRISLRQMALELNRVAPPGSLIVVTRSAGLLARYTRPDLVVDKPINSILDLERGYDYIVQVTRGRSGDLYPEIEALIVIERQGALLATAKYVRDVSGK